MKLFEIEKIVRNLWYHTLSYINRSLFNLTGDNDVNGTNYKGGFT